MADASIALAPLQTKPRSALFANRKIVIAACAGTIFEWYDFFLYGTLAVTLGAKFFSQFDETSRNIFALLTFAIGFVVRPLGGLLFGRFGDQLGRKNVFLATIVLMGASTFAVGLLPSSETIGFAAPIALLALRLVQGLAVSGEYGGAVIYLAEHAPPARRGLYAGLVPACIGVSLLLTLLVILVAQGALGAAAFDAWGWRIPFLASAVLVGLALPGRLRLEESPAFLKLKQEDRRSKAPISEALLRPKNLRLIAIGLFGMAAGVAATGYTGTIYVLIFMTVALKIDPFTANVLFAIAMLAGAGACVGFAWLSDRIGRKPIILAGCLLAALCYFPIFKLLTEVANPSLAAAQRSVTIVVTADPVTCSFQFNPAGVARFDTGCDKIRSTLARAGAEYRVEAAPPGATASVVVGSQTLQSGPSLSDDLTKALAAAGYPTAKDPKVIRIAGLSDLLAPRSLAMAALLLALVIFAQMTQGPAAAALVELFPTSIRYTSMSLPYQIATGWIGGLLPATVFAMNAQAGNMFFGLWYPVIVTAATVGIGLVFLPETKDRDVAA